MLYILWVWPNVKWHISIIIISYRDPIYLFIIPSFLLSLEITDLFTVSIVLSFPKCHTAWIILIYLHILIAFSYWLILCSNRHLRFLHDFLWLESSYIYIYIYIYIYYCFLALNNISLSRCTTIYPFTYWRTSWLLPNLSNFK